MRKTKKNKLYLPVGINGKYPGYHPKKQQNPSRFKRFAKIATKRILFNNGAKYPPMLTTTKAFLDQYYAKENQGLASLIKKSLKKYWLYMEE